MQPQRRVRSAFTLIELLVVIAIIGVLTAMGAGAYFATVKRQQINNTRVALQSLETMAMKHWEQVKTDAKKEDVPLAVVSFAGGDQKRARVIWTKLRLMEAFPTSFAEISNPNANFWPYASGLIPASTRKYMYDYQKKYSNGIASTGGGQADPQAESAACLLLSLSVARGGNKLERDALGAAYFRDTNGDGLEEIIDGWSKAIKFERFPTNNPDLQATNPQKSGKGAKFADPVDPDGYLLSWVGGSRGIFETNVHPIGSGTAFYVIPIMSSAGPDSQFGTGDEIYSFTLKQ